MNSEQKSHHVGRAKLLSTKLCGSFWIIFLFEFASWVKCNNTRTFSCILNKYKKKTIKAVKDDAPKAEQYPLWEHHF